ncbi:hypothetical protein HYE82_17835 [Streptomyces sp. BR123]|uniref:hypothetical protein n=1 Tax=Streptomyces sp. BR123 TaxID=2749828 RepID=UPI0015C44A5E|nr:hypothetical protein [Streptomyces sp. BR123]NXY96212.1 hypothetical protein [Streptomyces sp. BR123]
MEVVLTMALVVVVVAFQVLRGPKRPRRHNSRWGDGGDSCGGGSSCGSSCGGGGGGD